MSAQTIPDRARRAASGARAVALGQACRFLLQLAGLTALARLLTPADFGLVAMVTAVVGIGEVLRDFGLSSAAIQARQLSRQQRDNLFWLNAGIGAALALGLVVCAPLVQSFYGQDGLSSVVMMLAPAVLLNALSTQYRAGLTRDLRFTALAVSDVVAQAVAVAVAVTVALTRGDYLALVGQQLALALAGLVMLAVWSRWVPGLPRRADGTSRLVRFGGNVAATQLLGYLSRNVDTLVIGRAFGEAAVGLYGRAFQLLMLPLSQINGPATSVALPVLSRSQDDPADFRRMILRSQTVLLTLVLAAISLLFTTAPLVVATFLGDQWDAVVPVMRVLCLGGAFQAAGYVSYWCFVALGRTGSHLRFTLVSRPLLVGAVVVGSAGGVLGVAGAYGLGVMVVWFGGLWWLRAEAAVPTRQMLTDGLVLVTVFGVSAGVGAGVATSSGQCGLVAAAALGVGAQLLTLAVAYLTVRRFRASARATTEFVRLAVRRPPRPKSPRRTDDG
jgi:PST family polysaccharide transporter